MDYFEAVQTGRERVKEATDLLQSAAGPCYPMLFLKLGIPDWTPVGKDNLYATIPGKEGLAAIAVCDGEGNSKAMTPMVPEQKAEEYAKVLESKGIRRFEGEVKLPL